MKAGLKKEYQQFDMLQKLKPLVERLISIIKQKYGARLVKRALKQSRRNYSNTFDEHINDISSIAINDPIVHEIHGIGRYKGLINMPIENINTELIKIEYANADILYITTG